MTIDVKALRERVRASADAAAQVARERRAAGNHDDFQFSSGRQAAFVTVLGFLAEAEEAAAAAYEAEIAEALEDELIGEEAARLGLIGGAAVDLNAVERLEAFARGEDDGAADSTEGQYTAWEMI